MKTITLDEEAYEILATLKVDARDSFSKVVKRHFRRSGRIRSSAGSWGDVTDDEIAALRRETVATFETRRRRG
jgi:predicted CopG family antitoxin